PDCHRLQNRQGVVAAQILWRRRRWFVDNCGRTCFLGRWKRQLCGVRCEKRKPALAYAHREHLQRAANLHARWTPARACRRRRHTLRLPDVLRRLNFLFGERRIPRRSPNLQASRRCRAIRRRGGREAPARELDRTSWWTKEDAEQQMLDYRT